jgi:hypothetical protein
VFRPGRRLATFYPTFKDKVPINENPGAVYSIPCSSCSVQYIGETMRRLNTRVKEHVRDIKYRKNTTALSDHALQTGHGFMFDQSKVLYRAPFYHERLFLEAWEIQRFKCLGRCCCNSSSGKVTVPAEYALFFSSSDRP